MADVKISALPAATTPLAGTEVLPIVQSSTTKQVAVADLTAGCAVSAFSLTLTTPLSASNGGTGITSFGAGVATALGNAVNGASGICVQDASGNLGLGVTPSAWNTVTALQIKNAAFGGYSGYSYMMANAYYSSGWKYTSTDYASRYEQNSGGHQWHVAGSGSAGSAISFTQAMTLNAAGELLVGTTSGFNNSRVSIISDNSGLNRYTLNVQNTAATSTSQTQNILMRLSSNGAGADTCINFTDAVTHNYYVGGANGELYAINGYGGAKIVGGGTAWSSNSDERLKNISGYYNDALNDISQIMPFKFTWKDRDNKPCVGVSAQSVQKVIPEAVDEGSDGYLMVRYTDMLPLVIASIQELAAKVSALEAKI